MENNKDINPEEIEDVLNDIIENNNIVEEEDNNAIDIVEDNDEGDNGNTSGSYSFKKVAEPDNIEKLDNGEETAIDDNAINIVEDNDEEEVITGSTPEGVPINYGAVPKKQGGVLKIVLIVILIIVLIIGIVVFLSYNSFKKAGKDVTMKVASYEVTSIAGYLGREIPVTNIEKGTEAGERYLWYDYEGSAFTINELSEYLNSLVEIGYEGYITEMEEGYYVYNFYKFIEDQVVVVRVIDQSPYGYSIGFINTDYIEEDFAWMDEVETTSPEEESSGVEAPKAG